MYIFYIIYVAPYEITWKIIFGQKKWWTFYPNWAKYYPYFIPFELSKVERDEIKQEVHLYLILNNSHIPKGYSLRHYPRIWEHLKLFEYRCFSHCDLPIYKHKDHGTFKEAEVAFSRYYSRFTLKFEAEMMRLMKLHHCFL